MIIVNNVKRIKLMLDKIIDVKEFCALADKYPNLDLVTGKYRVAATSLMGIFSLDLTNPVKLEYPEEYHNDIIKDFEKWIVEE